MTRVHPSRATRLATMALLSLGAIACADDDDSTPRSADDTWALSYDGVDDYVIVADADALDLTGEITLMTWFYFDGGITGEPGIVQKDGPSSFGRYGLWVLGDEIDFCIYVDGGGQHCMYSTGVLTPAAWNHVAATYDGAEMRIYLNGQLDSTQPLAGAISTSDHPLYIGSDPSEPRFLKGRLHEMSIWETTLSEQQIMDAMDSRLTGNEPGLVAYWPMDEGSGQIIADASPNGLDGILGSSAAPDEADPTWSSTRWPH
jgi:hypothetical protein